MAKRTRAIAVRRGAILVCAAAFVPLAFRVNGLPAHESAPPVPATAPTPAPVGTAAIAAPTPPQGIVIKRILDVPTPFRHGDYAWDDTGVPQGPILVTIDLAAQTLSVFRAGYEIGAAVILHGDNEKPTPLGTFAITQKSADHVSSLYHVPMPFMLRLTDDGITIHGSDVLWGNATNGCIGVPTRFAALLFDAVKLGDPVVITDGQRLGMGDPILG